MSTLARYQANYDKIAADHVRYWRETGNNPFQEEGILRHNEASTVHYIQTYAPEGRWLDVGCGMGDLLMHFPHRKRHGVDISRLYLDIAAERGLMVAQAPIEKVPFPASSFDLVTATDVLEHVLDLNAAVEEMLRVLKRGGTLIVRTPNEEVLSVNNAPYEFVHLRRFDQATMHLLFHNIFDCEVLAAPVDGDVLHAVVRK